jgi:BirA family biotin operon repressor/biotin-[acetyl-CoA-carboxylase] ligase
VAPTGWSVTVVEQTGSTNADLAATAAAGPGRVLAAEEQIDGRGRLGRGWQAPARSSLAVSVLLQPGASPETSSSGWSWLPLVTGLAVLDAVEATVDWGAPATADRSGPAAHRRPQMGLKWPNDIVVGGQKLGGILVERLPADPPAVVIGIGLNVDQGAVELPIETATSIRLLGGRVDRTELLGAVLTRLSEEVDSWQAGDPALPQRYRERCVTLGRAVRVHLPGGRVLEGSAVDIDAEGCLVVDAADGSGHRAVAAGDVVHVR